METGGGIVMKMRSIGLALLVLCILGGVVAALFSPALAATLTLPATPGVSASMPGQTPGAGTASPAATRPVQEQVPTTGVTGVVLAQDTFKRTDQKF